MQGQTRRRVLITGAAGGIGRTCARLFGATHDLLLTDVRGEPLARFAAELEDEGYRLTGTHAGELCDAALLATLADAIAGDAATVIHAAGLSPALADWRAIITTNLVATERLLRAIEPVLRPGSVAILIASVAGYRIPAWPEAQAILADPLAPDFIARIGALLEARSNGSAMNADATSYALSKQAVHRLCERRADAWGGRGARIVSVSPGLTLTPMGRSEMAANAAGLAKAPPLGRTGTAMDVALAARFLASDEASFITGCDLKVDGGNITRVL